MPIFCINFADMKIHLFNPEHDIALAANIDRFTAPHAGRALRTDLGFIAALWADEGDVVVVDDVEAARESVRHLKRYARDVTFVSLSGLSALPDIGTGNVSVHPWGWDKTVRDQLIKADSRLAGVLPSDERLHTIREISSRRFAAERVLPVVREADASFVGESRYCTDMAGLDDLVASTGRCILKAPWSSSGRGLRYIAGAMEPHQRAWAANIIRRQGGVMLEPLYNKVKDFGVEFRTDGNGNIEYCGLSVFRTVNGAYAGNLLATEDDKLEWLSDYISVERLGRANAEIIKCLSPLLRNIYKGEFGVDMMVVSAPGHNGFMLHPCVEINFRMTMGHVALALSPSPLEPQRLMRIDYDGHYHLRMSTLKTTNQ